MRQTLVEDGPVNQVIRLPAIQEMTEIAKEHLIRPRLRSLRQGRNMRCQCDLLAVPERPVRRIRFLTDNIKRRMSRSASGQCAKQSGFIHQCPAANIEEQAP